MDINKSKQIVKIARNLNMESSRELKRELAGILDRGTKRVELDFSGTESIDSSGLGKLLLFNEKFKENGGDFRIINVEHRDVAELFRLISLERYITIEYKN